MEFAVSFIQANPRQPDDCINIANVNTNIYKFTIYFLAMRSDVNRQLRLAVRPETTAMVSRVTWELCEAKVPEPGPGQVLVRNMYVSVDPAMRGWIRPPAYLCRTGRGGFGHEGRDSGLRGRQQAC